MGRTIDAVNPATGNKTASIEASDKKEIEKRFKRSEKAFKEWKSLSIRERVSYLKNLRERIVEEADSIVEIVKRDTGKPDNEILMSDILATLSLVEYYENKTGDILGRKKMKTPFEFYKNSSYVEYEPMGVVVVISPWNYPFQLSIVPAITALAAGNTVILKPSEETPLTGEKIKDLIRLAGFPEGVFQVVQGDGEIGEHLINQGPDKVFFTGGSETGKKIMKHAAEQLIPVELELGGKDPAIVFEDADLDRTVKGIVYGSLANSGQLCVSTERVYVQESIKDEFIWKLKSEIRNVDVGDGRTDEMGPMITEEQLEKVMEQVDDAVMSGAELHTDLERNGMFLKPQLVENVDHGMDLMVEETFGPVIPVMSFKDEDEAVELANDSKYGLNASVWTKDINKGKRVASKLETGNCYINDVVKNIGNPHLPFGGVKESGIGRYHGEEGLKSFVEPKSVMVNRNNNDEMNWFPYTEDMYSSLKDIIHAKHKDIGMIDRLKKLYSTFKEISD